MKTTIALLVARRASDHVSQFDGKLGWKSLYLQERLCDCLYYARYDAERAPKRRTLLKDQQNVYGPNARNTLWTLINVADDYLQVGDCKQARTSFQKALSRSETLSGYGRAKTRFAALEGLARCSRNEAISTWKDDRFGGGEALERTSKMKEAIRYFEDAEAVAKVWFDSASRRIANVRVAIREIEVLL